MNYNHLLVKKKVQAAEWDKNTHKDILQYAVGGLLYAPGDHSSIGRAICEGRYPALKNIVLCLEDSILDCNLEAAEGKLLETLAEITACFEKGGLTLAELPLLFIRIRNSKQMLSLYHRLGNSAKILTGFVIPKLEKSNLHSYCEAVLEINKNAHTIIYAMPVIESPAIMNKQTRLEELTAIRQEMDKIEPYILNIRVGGNDFCNLYGLRRNVTDTVYDISVVKDVLTDIINVFAENYVVSAPVWEYFGETEGPWKAGLERELALDKLNGFIGKTAIHPSQLPVIQSAYVVEAHDYADALSVLNWKSATSGVEKSLHTMRMNEVKIHERWAKKVMALAKVYGVKENAYIRE